MQFRRNRAQHEAENEQIETVHGIADGGGGKRLPCKGTDLVGGFGDVGVDGGHRRLLNKQNSVTAFHRPLKPIS